MGTRLVLTKTFNKYLMVSILFYLLSFKKTSLKLPTNDMNLSAISANFRKVHNSYVKQYPKIFCSKNACVAKLS
jgi:hypothetical protein